jgi:hypothetical protein
LTSLDPALTGEIWRRHDASSCFWSKCSRNCADGQNDTSGGNPLRRQHVGDQHQRPGVAGVPVATGAKDGCEIRDDDGIPGAARSDPAMVKAPARAIRRKRKLAGRRYVSISAIAFAGEIDRGYVGTIFRPTLLVPDIIGVIMNGRQTVFGVATAEDWPPVRCGGRWVTVSDARYNPAQSRRNERMSSAQIFAGPRGRRGQLR